MTRPTNYMTFPILEFDPTPLALIEPSHQIKKINIPQHCVICFFQDVLDEVIEKYNAKEIHSEGWESGNHKFYEIETNGKHVAFFHPGVGAPLAAGLFETAIALGATKFIACGGCGSLNKEIMLGHLVIVRSAIRDEGCSYHYLPPSREVEAGQREIKIISTVLESKSVPFVIGKTWTTDAPYRETPAKIASRREEGALVVEMECSAFIAVAKFRGVEFGQILYGGDDLSGSEWDSRHWATRSDIRKTLFWLAVEACLAL